MYQRGRFLLFPWQEASVRTGELAMARYEFRFIVTDAELSQEQQRAVSQAVAEAGTLAVAAHTPRDAVTVVGESPLLGIPWMWRGIPPVGVAEILQAHGAEQANLAGGGR
jgi:hypothetical protein